MIALINGDLVNQQANSRTFDLSSFPELPSKSNLTALIHYLVQLEVNKTVAALTAINDVTGIGDKISQSPFLTWLPGAGNQSPSNPPPTPPSASPSIPFRFPYQPTWVYIQCSIIDHRFLVTIQRSVIVLQSTAAEFVRPVYSSYWMPYLRPGSPPNGVSYRQAAKELRMLKEQYPDVLDASGTSEPSVTLTFRSFLSLLGSIHKGDSDRTFFD